MRNRCRASRTERIRTALPSTSVSPVGDAVDAEHRACQLGATGADQSVHADDLAGVHRRARSSRWPVEVLTSRSSRAGTPVRSTSRCATSSAASVRPTMRFTTSSRVVSAMRLRLHDRAAVAEHRDRVAVREDLVELVAHQHDRGALRAELAHDLVEPLRLVDAERRGRLVEQQHLRLAVEAARDLDQLGLRRGQVAHRRPRVDVEVEHLEAAPGLAPHRRPVDPAQAPRHPGQRDVLADAELADDVALLVDDADAGGHGLERVRERHRPRRRAAACPSRPAGRRSRS